MDIFYIEEAFQTHPLFKKVKFLIGDSRSIICQLIIGDFSFIIEQVFESRNKHVNFYMTIFYQNRNIESVCGRVGGMVDRIKSKLNANS